MQGERLHSSHAQNSQTTADDGEPDKNGHSGAGLEDVGWLHWVSKTRIHVE